jgi:bacteriocin-like protein
MKKSKLKLDRTTIQQMSESELAAVNGGSIVCTRTIVACPPHSNGGPAICYTDVCQVQG